MGAFAPAAAGFEGIVLLIEDVQTKQFSLNYILVCLSNLADSCSER